MTRRWWPARKHPAAGTVPPRTPRTPPPGPHPDGLISGLADMLNCPTCRPDGHGQCGCTEDCGHPMCAGGGHAILHAVFTPAELAALRDLFPRWCKVCEAYGDLVPATGDDGLCNNCRDADPHPYLDDER